MTISDAISENELLATVIGLCEVRGLMVEHVFDTKVHARRSGKGFPDLTIANPKGGMILFVELKDEDGKLSPDQERWRDAVSNNIGCRWYLWRPSDLLNGTIEKLLESDEWA